MADEAATVGQVREQLLIPRKDIPCVSCGKVLLRGCEPGELGDTNGYRVERPFAIIPSCTRVIDKQTLPDGRRVTMRETPEVCLDPKCFATALEQWPVCDYAAEREERTAEHARFSAEVRAQEAHWAATSAERDLLQGRADAARDRVMQLIGADNYVDVFVDVFERVAVALLLPAEERAALGHALLEANAAQKALDVYWAAASASVPGGPLALTRAMSAAVGEDPVS